jgi:MoaA/NifB/PqqE/SkfB family radical SAM enzyme
VEKRIGKNELNSLSLNSRTKYYSGLQALPIRLKFVLGLRKYFWHKNEFPLFILNPFKGGTIKTLAIMRKLQLRKIIKFNDHYYLSLTVPHWPSEAFDRMVALGGLNVTAAGTRYKTQIDIAILAITSKCDFKCKHCYEYFNLGDEDPVSIERWKEVIREIQKIGVNIIALSGGEPMSRFEGLLELLNSGNKSLSEFHLYTSGHSLTFDRASELKRAGLSAVAVGLDDVEPERNDSLRGFKGAFNEAVKAIENSQKAGLFTYINMCLTKGLVLSEDLWKFFDMAKELNVGAIRLLEPKPCGGYLQENPDALFSEQERQKVTQLFKAINQKKRYKDHPLVAYEDYVESPERLGCMMGGHTHLHIDSKGHLEPCVFLPVSFGNILEEDFATIYRRMRELIPRPLHKRCPSIHLSKKIKDYHSDGASLPIPITNVQREWLELFEGDISTL